ncbi:MAG: alkylation response protein AidB-like acyl-CoA dehydrogenase [Polaribacter sp.]|jgi:alkylation response protein AidB-like acyl-CoA dehydrogenase
MPQYKAPVEDMKFILHDWLKVTELYSKLGLEDASDEELINAIIDESAKFAETQLSPLNHPGDSAGCIWEGGKVTTPKGFPEVYKQFCDAGWASLGFSTEFGGQGLPASVAICVGEMNASANTSWSMYPGLTHGVVSALTAHGNKTLKERYLPNLIQGRWTGTMCLTEAHCGSDLGLLKTSAKLIDNGNYSISGTKIFISAGEHDMSDNIIHLVLARLPDAPKGTRGISLFIVPKINEDTNAVENNNLPTDNNVTCGSIEHKMGIKASATCVMNFDNSIGYLVGEENKGLSYMFTMMNSARLATGTQGYAIADLSRSASLDYAKDRLQMRSLSGAKYPEKTADPIIVHPDVKRMLMSQKAIVEGCRGLAFYVSTLIDQVKSGVDENGDIEERLGLLTPICKALMSELGFESANHAVQVLGGHGFIKEWELEQQVRDARIAMIYEGTNGIQALDLLGRKIMRDKGQSLQLWITEINQHCNTAASLQLEVSSYFSKVLNKASLQIKEINNEWLILTQTVATKGQQNPEEIGAAAFDFLMYSGYISLASMLLQMATVAYSSNQSPSFIKSKFQVLDFYIERILPRTKMHKACILSSASVLDCEEFDLD